MTREDLYGESDNPAESTLKLDRREFLKLTGGGILILFSLGEFSTLEAQRREYPTDFNAYLLIGEDGRISCFTGKIEMGQGVITSLAQMAAEELCVPLDSVKMVMGDTELCPWDGGTHGSLTTRFFGPPLRAASAKAREVLLELASAQMKVPPEQLVTENGKIFERGKPGKALTYAQLAKRQKITRELEREAVQKVAAEFKVIGVPTIRTDAREKVTGQARFAGDIRYPGLLYAKILRPPAHRAQLKSADTSAAEKMAGVTVVRQDDLIACLHLDPEMAEKALQTVRADFEIPQETVDDKNIFDHLLKVAQEGNPADEKGSLETGEKQASRLFEAKYLNSYVAHSPIEPHTATAEFKDGKVEVWASTQSPFGIKESIANALNLPSEKVHVRTPFVGGGFGGKSRNTQAEEAARLSMITGKPVQVAWTRAEEFFYDTFRPAAVVLIKSGIDDQGRIVLWDYKVYFAGSRGASHTYDIPNNRITVFGSGWGGAAGTHPFATGAWRAPGANTNVFSRESQIDMMAAKAGIDPLEFRLKNMKDDRMLGVLRAAADKFGWKPAVSPSGRGFGISCGVDSGTYVASIAEVAVDKNSGHVQVKRVVCAQDMGLVINPEGAKIQMEGCITMGLGYALTEEIHFKGGKIFDANYDSYAIPRFSWLPEIETVLIEAKNSPAQGGGEPAIINMGAVVANAIFDASGARLYQLPMTPDRIKAALKA